MFYHYNPKKKGMLTHTNNEFSRIRTTHEKIVQCECMCRELRCISVDTRNLRTWEQNLKKYREFRQKTFKLFVPKHAKHNKKNFYISYCILHMYELV